VYGRTALLKHDGSAVKSATNLITAGKNGSEWLKRVKRAEVACVRLGDDGPDVTFLLESNSKSLRFTNIQQAAATLSNSKLQMLITQVLICRLYDTKLLTNVYT
jgi:hypothetical protein